MEVLDNLLYTEDHEWLRVENNKVYIGITDFAQSELGDIIFVELPSIDDNVDSGGTIGTIEAVKTVADVYTPVKGKIIEINENIVDQPELINSSPYNDGWIACIEFDVSIDEVKTLSSEEYLKFIGK
ncbi:MAG: glycine cleavage system protein H [Candidatus Marinimicrobia bacterium]|nr:glycine cleavage system protein H [Candidatus Neomarinimicrobiota bacterium]|tara:strand:- start:399 stop:779 length:381 start_codon:yes stop_codon:yes gene_type:complete